jgi:hypothetical protein
LQPALHELIEGQTKDVIEFSLIILEETKLHNSARELLTLDERDPRRLLKVTPSLEEL